MKKKERNDLIALLVCLLIISLGAVLLVSLWRDTYSDFIPVPHTVVRGDTLDGLYYQYGEGDLLRWRYEVKRLNGMEDSCLYEGKEILVLVKGRES